jgi:phosphotransferase system HPr-like phosphotransfer protein
MAHARTSNLLTISYSDFDSIATLNLNTQQFSQLRIHKVMSTA